ncbi:hypothetical protein KP509_07G009700 [Ceratopteris richardii]|uniref:L-arabinokinase n=1 Tax=Ceratopteris richardii TaxID=49495 RepID=A0A8T2U9S8_CERRI|nr:hypothetical protein KP509_07G009700 [Ceratopteris richardii]
MKYFLLLLHPSLSSEVLWLQRSFMSESWDFIYADYVMAAGLQYRSIVWQIAEDYSYAEFLLRLPGYCPMPAFRDTIDVPLIVRKPVRSKEEVRKEFGINDGEKLLLFNFGGQDASWSLEAEFLPEGWKCLVCAAPAGQILPPNFKAVASDVYTPDLIAASDCMLGKIGYGTTSEALAFEVPFVFVRRDYFNEEPFLRNMLEYHHCGVEMIRRDFLTGCWSPYLTKALRIGPSYKGPLNGGEVIAQIVEEVALGRNSPFNRNGVGRLQDAIVFGLQMQRIPGQEVGIPMWYTHAEKELALRSAAGIEQLHPSLSKNSLHAEVENFEILYGDGYNLLDTKAFLTSLSNLANMTNEKSMTMSKTPLLREWLAAAGLFDWKEDIYVARAPGRLDVMGGIGDYSGSLVLQMPIGEACHVAVQLSQPGRQPLWKHAIARKGSDAGPVVQIVSLGAELCNRAPTFDMDISDFLDVNGNPITYECAREYFGKDPSQKWAAYVAGTILVLMREKGVEFEHGLSILVSSAVPEGKGVSSSAAVEVATMSALIAAYGLNIAPREMAVLCQKVENHVVGAPCGVMDQMASACGEAYKLLAMICQPAEVKEHVNIPTHIQFWGMDSGIRHSVGGTDYGSVRIGTFMGRAIIKTTAAELSSSPSQTNGPESSNLVHKEFDTDSLHKEKEEHYLCNILTYRYDAIYAKVIPEQMRGEDFIKLYGSHEDEVTNIDPCCVYPVKAPTTHAVYDNFRSKTFAVLLESTSTAEQLEALGELMYQSHNSYSSCGLGSAGTDLLVQFVRQSQQSTSRREKNRLFGAKITGGGCGGTVCIMGWNSKQTADEICKIRDRYKETTGHSPFIFEGSSPGAGSFGYLRIRLKSISI